MGGGREPPQESRRRVKSSRGDEGSHGSPSLAQPPLGSWLHDEHCVRTPVNFGLVRDSQNHLRVMDTATIS